MKMPMCDPGRESPFEAGRIPSLDGLRAFSIALVMFAHVSGTRFFPSFVGARRDLGNIGVRIFFVISGFLITTLLLKELSAKGSISLKSFYFRRVLRIFPCAYAYIAVSAILTWLGWIALGTGDFVHALTYTVNYELVRPWQTIHLWSLSVEEQFYLLWPMLLLWLGARRGIRMAAFVIVLAPLVRIGTWYWLPSWEWSIGTAFQTNADALAAGCILAGVWGRLSSSAAYLRFLNSKLFILVPASGVCAGVLLSSSDPRLVFVSYLLGQTVLNLSIALIIDRCVRYQSDLIGGLLNSRPLVFVGMLSYSLYLWQEPFLNRLSDAPVNWFPINLILASAAALGSYYLVERPFLNLRRRLESSATPRREKLVSAVAR